METYDMSLTLDVGSYNGVCLPSNEGSTGYHWVLPIMPNCINRTNDEWIPAIRAPVYPGIPGIHVFIFQGVTPTSQSPVMEFLLMPPGSDEPAAIAKCKVTVK